MKLGWSDSEHSFGTFDSSLLSDWMLFDYHVSALNRFSKSIFKPKQTTIFINFFQKSIFFRQ